MLFPPHLFKPFDASDLVLSKTENLPIGVTTNWFAYSPAPGIIAVIKEINNTDNINEVGIWYYKGGAFLFLHGQTALFPAESKRPDHFFEYLRENPIILTETDTLILNVGNNSGASQNVAFKAFGYTYPVWRHDEKKESVLK